MPHNAKGTPVLSALIAALYRETQEVVMNVRLVASPILVLLLSRYAPGQQMPRGVDETGPPSRVTANSADAYKQKLIRRVAVAEAAVRQAEAAHETNVALSKAYVQIGLWCQNAAQRERSE